MPLHGAQHLVLLGAGPAHLQVLAQLAAHPPAATVVTLVAPQTHTVLAQGLASYLGGHTNLEACRVAIEPLVQRGGIHWVQQGVSALDAQGRSLTLDNGSTLHYDWLSINTPAIQNREALEQTIPGVREHALFLRPLEAFVTLWPRVLDMGASRPLRVAVIGGGASGVELALAARQRLPRSAVTLLSGSRPPGAGYPLRVQQQLLGILKRRGITVLQDRAVGLKAGSVQLGCGADLACDVPLLATGPQPPAWAALSGLALDAKGFIAVDACLRSTSHPHVLAAGEVSTRTEGDSALRQSDADPRVGLALAHNLVAGVSGAALKPCPNAASTPRDILSCGNRYAVASWNGWSAQGWWVWLWKDWTDRRFMARYQLP
jgi:NADH dehydrogenase FAD-containing subunit